MNFYKKSLIFYKKSNSHQNSRQKEIEVLLDLYKNILCDEKKLKEQYFKEIGITPIKNKAMQRAIFYKEIFYSTELQTTDLIKELETLDYEDLLTKICQMQALIENIVNYQANYYRFKNWKASISSSMTYQSFFKLETQLIDIFYFF